MAALNKLTANKALIATVAAVESLTEQLASELHNLVLARSSSKRGKREATGSNRKKKYVSTEASSPVSNGVQPREKTVNPVASDVPVPICKQENETALSAEVKQCPEEEKVDDGMGPPASFSSAREASSEDFSETEASASKDKPLNRLLKRHGCTTAKMQTICEQTVMELVSQPVAMPVGTLSMSSSWIGRTMSCH